MNNLTVVARSCVVVGIFMSTGLFLVGNVYGADQAGDPAQAEIAGKITTEHDDFKKHTTYKGPAVLTNSSVSLFIRAWKPDDIKDDSSYQIYVVDKYYGEWRHYQSAFDDAGNSIDVTVIDRDVDCSRVSKYSRSVCTYTEHIGLNVTRKYLEARADNGVRIKVSGNAGEEIFFVPANYIKAFISTVPQDVPKAEPIDMAKLFPKQSGSKPDMRTPEQRYEGSFLGARAICLATYNLSQKVAELRENNLPVDAELSKQADLGSCIKKRLAEMAIEYKKFLSIQKTKPAKDALTSHYVAAVLTVKGVSPFIGEKSSDYKQRQIENKRIADENWVRFELAK